MGSDWIDGSGGNDVIRGYGDDDWLIGGSGSDEVYGGGNNDTLWGGANNDQLFGGPGNDEIYGDNPEYVNRIDTPAYSDVLTGDEGNDTLYGGLDDDTYVFHAGDGDDLIKEEARGGYEFVEIWGEGQITSLSQIGFSIPAGTDDLLIDLGSSGGQDLGSVRVQDMGATGSWVEGLHLYGAGGQLIDNLYLVERYNQLAASTPPGNEPPVLMGPSVLNYGPNQSIPISFLITWLTDANGQNTIAKVHFEDTRDWEFGWFESSGSRWAVDSWDAPYAQISDISYFTGPNNGSTQLIIRAYDDHNAPSNELAITVNVTGGNRPPDVTATNVSLQPGASLPLSSLFSWSDPEGDNITSFAVRDRTAGGAYLTKNGVSQPSGELFNYQPIGEISQWQVVGGTGPATDEIGFNAYDSKGAYNLPSAVAIVTTGQQNHPPQITGPSVLNAQVNQVLQGHQLFDAVSDQDGLLDLDRLVFWDATPGAGYIALDGVKTTKADVSVTEHSRVTYVTGDAPGSNDIVVEAFDKQGADSNDLLVTINVAADTPPPGTGTAGNDTIIGTDGNDTIVGLAGDDDLRGLAGDDTYRFDVGWGHDQILDSAGNDEIAFGTSVEDSDIRISGWALGLALIHSNGDSILINEVSGSPIEAISYSGGTSINLNGPLLIQGTNSDDYHLSGRGGNDTIYGYAGHDWLYGGDGNDTIDGGDGTDWLEGQAGNDALSGGEGGDSLIGGDGNDSLNGGSGTDGLDGGAGNDSYVFGGAWGNDFVFERGDASDPGNRDTLVFQGLASSQVSFNTGVYSYGDLIITDGTNSVAIGNQYNGYAVEQAQFSDKTIDLTGPLPTAAPTAGADTLAGTSGNDTFDGLAGNDSIDAGAGNDTLTGGSGADLLYGNAGNDVFNLGTDGTWTGTIYAMNRSMLSSAGVPDQRSISGRIASQDAFAGGDGTDSVIGTSGNDVLFYSDAKQPAHAAANASVRLASIEYFDLGAGDDVLDMTNPSGAYPTSFTAVAGEGKDALWGGLGDDTLDGGPGDSDFLTGGPGTDRLTGGSGKDIFGFSRNFGADTITDFENGQDNIRLKGFGAAYDTYAEVRAAIVQNGADAVLTLPYGVSVTLLNTNVSVFDATDFTIIA